MRWMAILIAYWTMSATCATAQSKQSSEMDARRNARELIVMFHAFDSGPESLKPLLDQLRRDGDRFERSDILRLTLPFSMFSTTSPEDAVADALARIDEAWSAKAATGQAYENIIIIGHSIGALYARKAYVVASGERTAAPFEPKLDASLSARRIATSRAPRPWAHRVSRLVLLAGLNRGWSISHHMSLDRTLKMTVGTWMGKAMGLFGVTPIAFSARRGSPFITQLRLQWLELRKDSKFTSNEGTRCIPSPPVGGACVIQLLGNVDDLVPPEDNVDALTGDDFIYLDVPRSGHASVIDVNDPKHGRERAGIILSALKLDDFSAISARLSGMTLEPNHKVKHVVFVMHGIRDEGYWTERISRRVVKYSREIEKQEVATETSSYGYFPMLSFLQPGARQDKVEWLMDRYTTAKAQYPNANFSYVGHSNGTYLLAKALQDYPAVKFRNVVFAGSVVNRDFDWSKLMEQQRVGKVLNFVASADWVVAWFPKALQDLGLQDLGSAGYDGFSKLPNINKGYVIGGHGAALDEDWWDAIATFVVTGNYSQPTNTNVLAKPASWVSYPALVSWAIWIVIAAVLGVLLYLIFMSGMREWKKTLAVIAYLFLIWTVLTSF